MFIGTSLSKADLSTPYDAIVIGSGIGGLATAAVLSKRGMKVLVLEKHYTAGGFTHTFARKGYEWDVGVHYIGEVHKKDSTLRRIFDYVSDGKIEWAPMPDVYDRIYLGEESYDYVSGGKSFRKKMLSYFPNEATAIDSYLSLLRKINRSSQLFFLERALPPPLSRLLFTQLTKDYLYYSEKTTEEVMLGITQNRKLINVLTGQWGDYGLPPEASSFAMHALVAKHYLAGASYPVGGSGSIARSIEPVIKKSGSQIVTRAEVESILVEDDKAVGVRLADQREIRAKIVVSGAGVLNTYKKLLPSDSVTKFGLLGKAGRVAPSMAHISVYMGLKGTTEELGLSGTNLWIYPEATQKSVISGQISGNSFEFPVVYISFPSTKDPAWKHKGKSTIEIVAPASYDWFKKWEGSEWKKRGADYEEFKKAISDALLEVLYQKHPQLRGRISYMEVATPLSTAHFSNYRNGEIYGIDHSPQRFSEKWLRTQTPIKNLYLTGQDIVTCGVAGALCGGILTGISILGPLRSLTLLKMFLPRKFRELRA